MAVWFFTPPVAVGEGFGPTDILEGSDSSFYTNRWINYFWKVDRGLDVWKTAGSVWVTGRFPTITDVNQALFFYYGGHISVVNDTNRTDIIAAGIGVTAGNFTEAPADTPLTPPPLGDDHNPVPPPYDAIF